MSTALNPEVAAMPRMITLRLRCNPKYAHTQLASADARRKFAAALGHIVCQESADDSFPYMTQPDDSYRWTIDKHGNDYWVHFNAEDNLVYQLACRYQSEAPRLQALAVYMAETFNSEIVS